MELYNSIKRIGKRILISGTLLGGLFFGAEKAAGTEPKLKASQDLESVINNPIRKITLSLDNPLDSFESNSKAWYSANQIIAKGHDYLGMAGLSRGPAGRAALGRAALMFSALYFNWGLRHYSHEVAHNYTDRAYGEKHGFQLDFRDWWNGLYPEYVQHPLRNSITLMSENDLFKGVVDGLNQDEYNAEFCWKQCLFNDSYDFYNSETFLLTKLNDLLYIQLGSFKDRRPGPGLTKWELFDFYFKHPEIFDDVNMYTGMLYNKKIGLTKESYFLQAFLADMLSLQFWDSFIAMAEYLEKGVVHKPLGINLGNKLKVYPPLISTYLTSDGTFNNAACFVRYGKNHLFEAAFGHDVDFIGDGKLKQLRLGGSYRNYSIHGVALTPFVYLNFKRPSFEYLGLSAGLEFAIQTAVSGVALTGKIEYNDNDLMENRIKGEEEKLKFSTGLEIKL